VPVDVVLEVAPKRTFASAVDWPGWSRSGRTEDDAVETLLSYAPRYAVVAELAGLSLPSDRALRARVVERTRGDATTEFGAPSIVADADREPLSAARARRLTSLLEAAWDVFDDVVAHAPAELRKGPRGGGRDRDAIVEHVVGAEVGYARRVRDRQRAPAPDPADREAVAAERAALVEVLARASDGSPLVPGRGWPPRYAFRRFAWHVLDHTWEIEDRSS
jgi:hypothetical protein